MTTRILPPEEWPKLAGTEAEKLWPLLHVERSRVIVVEHEGQIVGCWSFFWMPHVECLWIAPEHRQRSSVARRLWMAMRHLVRNSGADRVWTGADSDPVRALLAHVKATPIPGEHYVMGV